ncbi:MAG: hypothetical protein IPJ84_11645 [Bdellovibrionales bacterium]|nr:hypothetical protein [Bdellovibrionales bacterium]
MMLVLRLRKVWDELFRPVESELLGWFRAIFCSAVACEVFLDREFFGEKQASGFCAKLEMFEFFHLPAVSAGVYQMLALSLVAALLLSALGILGRLPLFVSVVLFGYVVGIAVGCDRGAGEHLYGMESRDCLAEPFDSGRGARCESVEFVFMDRSTDRIDMWA